VTELPDSAPDQTASSEAAAGGPALRQRRSDAELRNLMKDVELWRGSDGRGYGSIIVNGHREHWPLRSEGFANWLRVRAQLNGEPLLGAAGVERLQSNLNARACVLGETHDVCRRVGWHGGKIYVDLADSDWLAVEIVPAEAGTEERWRVVTDPPVRFLRTPGMRPMPVPMPGRTVDELRRWLNVESEADFRLTIAWILACYRGRGPYPILIVRGGKGSGKSTLTRELIRLTDPQDADMRTPPREERDLWVAAQGARVLSYDNLSSVAAWLADALCRLSTGGAYAGRTLRSDADETTLRGCQPVLLNAIVDLATRVDMADRSILVEANRLTERSRRSEEEFWADFADEEPMLLGAVFDAVSAALGAYRDTPVPANLRMADPARWAEAAAPFLKWGAGELSEWWRGNRLAGDLIALESDIVITALIDFLEGQDDGWEGSLGELLTRLSDAVPEKTRRSKKWPESVQGLTGRIDRHLEAMEAKGWACEIGKGGKGRRWRSFTRIGARPGRLPEE
jgi:hypothetical protein